MKSARVIFAIAAFLLLTVSAASSARLFAGYGGLRWGTDLHTVMKVFRNGNLGKIGGQMIYTQMNPDKISSQRTFGFGNSGLEAVSITLKSSYVKKFGIDKIIGQLIKNFGDGRMDRSSAPHLLSYIWEDSASRITLAYSASSPHMTVLLFQQKK